MIKLKDVDEKGEETELESGLDDLFPFVPDRFLKDLKMLLLKCYWNYGCTRGKARKHALIIINPDLERRQETGIQASYKPYKLQYSR